MPQRTLFHYEIMSLPCNDRVRSFYGKSYPTLARGSITKEGGSGEADRTGLASADAAVAPLLGEFWYSLLAL